MDTIEADPGASADAARRHERLRVAVERACPGFLVAAIEERVRSTYGVGVAGALGQPAAWGYLRLDVQYAVDARWTPGVAPPGTPRPGNRVALRVELGADGRLCIVDRRYSVG